MSYHICSVVALVFLIVILSPAVKTGFCPRLYPKGVIHLDVNPGFLQIDRFSTGNGNEKEEGLLVSSFFNVEYTYNHDAGVYVPNIPPFAPDQVGRIMNIGNVIPEDFDFATDFEKLTGFPTTTWPNEVERVPDGVLNFEAVIVPQGSHTADEPGRLSIINLQDLSEYVVHQSTLNPELSPGSRGNMPRSYQRVLFYDMDGDGFKDIVTVRSGFKIITSNKPPTALPPFSELVYFKNPGEDQLDADTPWQEIILYGGPLADPAFMGPDVRLAMHDFDRDGVPEIVATHFFSGDGLATSQPNKGKIAIYGTPINGTWKEVDYLDPKKQARVKVIDESHGFPFNLEIVDLNRDGKIEILATNHQHNGLPSPGIPGQVYVLEQPDSGDIFNDEWTTHILLDNILPQPTPSHARGMRRAPGHAMTFFPNTQEAEAGKRPWVLVSGDEAGKVWILKPESRSGLDYKTAIVFDINEYYGPHATQNFTEIGTTNSTIGKPAIRYTRTPREKENGVSLVPGEQGEAEIYIPVFEARDIHILSFKRSKGDRQITCPKSKTYDHTE